MRTLRSLAAAVLLLAGCTSGEPEAGPDRDPPEAATDTEEDDVAATKAADDPDAGADSDEKDTAGSGAPATGTVTYDEPLAVLEAAEDGAVRAEILELRRTGTTVELSFLVRNTHENDGWGAGYGYHRNFLSGGLGTDDPASSSIAGVALIDGDNQKRHYPLRDPDGNCACSTGQFTVRSQTSIGLFASFPAPPDDVEVMTVQIPEFGSVELALR